MTTTSQSWTIAALLKWTTDFFTRKSIEDPRLTAELLLAYALNTSRMMLYTQYDRVPADPQLAAFRELVKQRGEHVPVAYLIGKVSFFSLDLVVSRAVLIPRPDTETLVEQVIARVRAAGWEVPRILDLCTGSGCVAIALAKNLKTAVVTATDLSAEALAIARQNVELHKLADRITLHEGDLFGALPASEPPPQFHVIVSNPPYIPSGEIPRLQPEVRDHEPRLALDGGPDGLAPHRAILAQAESRLLPNALLALEIAHDHAPLARQLFESTLYLQNPQILRDAANNTRLILASKR